MFLSYWRQNINIKFILSSAFPFIRTENIASFKICEQFDSKRKYIYILKMTQHFFVWRVFNHPKVILALVTSLNTLTSSIYVLNREYVCSVAVYKKYLMRLGELMIFEPWWENYHFSQPSYIFLIYGNTIYVFFLSFTVWFVEFYYSKHRQTWI